MVERVSSDTSHNLLDFGILQWNFATFVIVDPQCGNDGTLRHTAAVHSPC